MARLLTLPPPLAPASRPMLYGAFLVQVTVIVEVWFTGLTRGPWVPKFRAVGATELTLQAFWMVIVTGMVAVLVAACAAGTRPAETNAAARTAVLKFMDTYK